MTALLNTIHTMVLAIDMEQIKSEPSAITAVSYTLLGMSIVFIVLIFISFIIKLLGYVPTIIEKLTAPKVKDEPAASQAAQPAAKTVVNTTAAKDDSEIIAVIAAAVAAAMSEETGTVVAPDGLVIRSIKRRR